MKYSFERDPEGGVVLVTVNLDKKRDMQLVLDTGASCTAFDSNVLLMEGYVLGNSIGTMCVETSNGIIDVDVFVVESLSAFGITRHNVQVQVYDFLAHGISSTYQGVLGLDFFEDTEFCINLKNNTIQINQYP
ncbi:hypothetical protein AGMMS4956_13700 [Bacteroidia bacterium]|nr:hypothetical protein AGMMS4956_13700 [Bacteroidia bacterium]